MEIVHKRNDGTVEYRFVHSTAYQSVQRQFETCVASMDPDRMIQLLQFNRKCIQGCVTLLFPPTMELLTSFEAYHIATLLQISEIAKQQRESAAAFLD